MSSTSSSLPQMTLYVLAAGLFPPRVLIYLKEKGVPATAIKVVEVGMSSKGVNIERILSNNPTNSDMLSNRAKTVPVLEIQNSDWSKNFITESIAILQYLEEIFQGDSELKNMTGDNPYERARHAEILFTAVEMTDFVALYLHKASAVFVGLEEQPVDAARILLERGRKRLVDLEHKIDEHGPFMCGPHVRLVDCVAYASFQFFVNAYGIADVMFKDRAKLERWYHSFGRRESASVEQMPEWFKQKAREIGVK